MRQEQRNTGLHSPYAASKAALPSGSIKLPRVVRCREVSPARRRVPRSLSLRRVVALGRHLPLLPRGRILQSHPCLVAVELQGRGGRDGFRDVRHGRLVFSLYKVEVCDEVELAVALLVHLLPQVDVLAQIVDGEIKVNLLPQARLLVLGRQLRGVSAGACRVGRGGRPCLQVSLQLDGIGLLRRVGRHAVRVAHEGVARILAERRRRHAAFTFRSLLLPLATLSALLALGALLALSFGLRRLRRRRALRGSLRGGLVSGRGLVARGGPRAGRCVRLRCLRRLRRLRRLRARLQAWRRDERER
mmetsp:Transcript_27299/g.77846  ORF Transcript_27299/g.77846 Transcript_27299/m.77846 type:complete len:303 (+) Transcript_27299:32-940(+)